MFELFVAAFFLGLLFNVVPGAVFAETLRRGLRGGYGPAFAVQVGSLVGDFTWAVLGLAGAGALFALPHVETPLALAGAALLLWLAAQSVRDGLAPVPVFDPNEPAGAADKTGIAVGAAMSLSNPMNITYWAGLGGTIAVLAPGHAGWQPFAVFLAGFMASSLLWCFVCAGLVAATRRMIGPFLWRTLNFGCAAGLAAFAVLVVARLAGFEV